MIFAIKKTFFHFLILATFIAGGFFAIQNKQNASAQTASQNIDFFIDWSAKTFIPADYSGKPLPTFSSIINLNATLLSGGGERVNENNYRFNWILDNSSALDSDGPTASFKVTNGASDTHKIYLRIFNKSSSALFKEYFFLIPISTPEVAVYKKSSDGLLDTINGLISVSAGSELNLIAKPYFFNNITDESQLKYRWFLNDKEAKGNVLNPNKLSTTFPSGIPSGTQYNLSLRVENPLNIYQLVEKKYKIIIQ